MKRGIYTVHDKVMEEAGPLFYANNNAHARRNFMKMISEVKVDKVLDYDLVYLGSIDVKTMEIDPCVPALIITEDNEI